MQENYSKKSLDLENCRSMVFGPSLKAFTEWLEKQGYHQTTIRRHIREIAHFAAWSISKKLTMPELHREALDKFRLHLEKRGLLRSPSGNYRHVYQSATVFVNFLETTGAVIVTDQISNQLPNLFLEFLQWMRIQRGTLDSTLKNYRLPIINLLQSLGTDPSVFTAKNLRAFLIRQISCSSQEKSKNWGTAIRMFLRFLIAKGRCQPGMEYAIPTIARWRLSTMPKYLPAEDVENLINSCDQTHIGIRDRAILLLLARLGLRASEVSGLKFSSIIWPDATLFVTGKNRCETRLPLPQDVGEAILHYLKCARPQASSDICIYDCRCTLDSNYSSSSWSCGSPSDPSYWD